MLQTQNDVAEAQLTHAQATNEQAEANLSRTVITAPVAGRVTKLSTAKGAYAAVGQTLMMFVPPEVWVTANFKETQLRLDPARVARRYNGRRLSRPNIQRSR